MNSNILEAQRKLVPEMVDVLHRRYKLLTFIEMSGPIGRRPLSLLAGLSERECRNEMESLRDLDLIRIAKEGTTITVEGAKVRAALQPSIDEWTGHGLIERKLQRLLHIQHVKIVPGDSDANDAVKNLLAKEAANEFTERIGDGEIVAVTGGTSVAAIPHYMHSFERAAHLHFIAARGGVGNDIGLQANVIAASFAHACGGTYSTFYYPESLSGEAHEVFKKEPTAQKMIDLYEKTDCVIHGIGDAQRMAEMRNTPSDETEKLQQDGAKGEAFGYYFDENGKIVHRIRTVGIQTEQLKKVPLIIACAGGKAKADAIAAYMASAPEQTLLVTDEGAALEIIRKLESTS